MKHIQALILPVINMHCCFIPIYMVYIKIISSVAILKTYLSVRKELLDILLL